MSSVINSTEDILETKFSTDYLLRPYPILLTSNPKFIIGQFADNHFLFHFHSLINKNSMTTSIEAQN